MIWNEIRNHLRERLPTIIDFILFVAAMAMIATVLLGLVWLYVEYGMFLFWVGVVAVCLAAILNERRRPIYTASGGWPELFGDSQPSLPPPGNQALPPPAAPQIGRSRRLALQELKK
jgi:hypothetical protein